jgi:hypothetical protein
MATKNMHGHDLVSMEGFVNTKIRRKKKNLISGKKITYLWMDGWMDVWLDGWIDE